jgi:hypothetical protein
VLLANQERNPQPSVVVSPEDITVTVEISNCCSVPSSYTECPPTSPSNQEHDTLLRAQMPLTKSNAFVFTSLSSVVPS